MGHEALVHRWFEEVWNGRNADAIDEMFAADGIAHGLSDDTSSPLLGPEGFKPIHQAFLAAYPDLHITVEDCFCDGDKIVARCRVRGTHSTGGLGVASDNRPVEFTGMTICRIQDGKIQESWNEFDFMKMYTQLGALTLNLL